jgi:putative cardiolipin synthase
VRLFNPFPGGRGAELTRFMSSGFEIGRVDRRMHNKFFVADNVAAVAGGRNMADEYVMNASGSNFVDMDVFIAGPVVRQLSSEFDHYWNSDAVYPARSLATSSLSDVLLREKFERLTATAKPPEPTELSPDGRVERPEVGDPASVPPELVPMLNLPFELARHHLSPLLWADARVLYDPLSKTAGVNEEQDTLKGTVTEGIVGWLKTARNHIKMVSPYFVPSDVPSRALPTRRVTALPWRSSPTHWPRLTSPPLTWAMRTISRPCLGRA